MVLFEAYLQGFETCLCPLRIGSWVVRSKRTYKDLKHLTETPRYPEVLWFEAYLQGFETLAAGAHRRRVSMFEAYLQGFETKNIEGYEKHGERFEAYLQGFETE